MRVKLVVIPKSFEYEKIKKILDFKPIYSLKEVLKKHIIGI